ncbi:unnamed protein product [Medioppia subpectinata]|uniref:Uncharacterized protein n=1 Tax=Medioppia subpectinata TaxID=1979941 RepID=A0A7R9KR04_9ACAR|nr:unnamed protein product [Medioppia subpectinata]CAG2106839.1 unnamed protein product [Medioppia subpectinata]
MNAPVVRTPEPPAALQKDRRFVSLQWTVVSLCCVDLLIGIIVVSLAATNYMTSEQIILDYYYYTWSPNKVIVIIIGSVGICAQFLGLWAVRRETYMLMGAYGTAQCFIGAFAIAWGLIPGYQFLWALIIIYLMTGMFALTLAHHIRRLRQIAFGQVVIATRRQCPQPHQSPDMVIVTPAYRVPTFSAPNVRADEPPTYAQSVANVNYGYDSNGDCVVSHTIPPPVKVWQP